MGAKCISYAHPPNDHHGRERACLAGLLLFFATVVPISFLHEATTTCGQENNLVFGDVACQKHFTPLELPPSQYVGRFCKKIQWRTSNVE